MKNVKLKESEEEEMMHIIFTMDGKVYPISDKFYEWLMQNPYPRGIVYVK